MSSNGHGRRDDGLNASIEREQAPILCLERCTNGGWCLELDQHTGEHRGAIPTYGPIAPPAWEMQKRRWWSQMRDDLGRLVAKGLMDAATVEDQLRMAWLFATNYGGVKKG